MSFMQHQLTASPLAIYFMERKKKYRKRTSKRKIFPQGLEAVIKLPVFWNSSV